MNTYKKFKGLRIAQLAVESAVTAVVLKHLPKRINLALAHEVAKGFPKPTFKADAEELEKAAVDQFILATLRKGKELLSGFESLPDGDFSMEGTHFLRMFLSSTAGAVAAVDMVLNRDLDFEGIKEVSPEHVANLSLLELRRHYHKVLSWCEKELVEKGGLS